MTASPYADGAVYVTEYTADFYSDRSLAVFQVEDGQLVPRYIPEEPLGARERALEVLDEIDPDVVFSTYESTTLGSYDENGTHRFLGYPTEADDEDLWVRHEGICGGAREGRLENEGYTVKSHHKAEGKPRIIVALHGEDEEGRILRVEAEIDREKCESLVQEHREKSFETLWRPIHTNDLESIDEHAVYGYLKDHTRYDSSTNPSTDLIQAYRQHAESTTIIVRHED